MKTLNLKTLCESLGVSSSTVYRCMDSNPKNKYYDSKFPKPKKIGIRSVRWLESEVLEYLKNQQTEQN